MQRGRQVRDCALQFSSTLLIQDQRCLGLLVIGNELGDVLELWMREHTAQAHKGWHGIYLRLPEVPSWLSCKEYTPDDVQPECARPLERQECVGRDGEALRSSGESWLSTWLRWSCKGSGGGQRTWCGLLRRLLGDR